MLALLCALGIPLAYRFQKRRAHQPQNLNRPLDVGQTVRIEQHLHDNMYQVQYRGTIWQAQLFDAASIDIGQTATIFSRQGNVLHIRPANTSVSQ